jgi:hypothetical protein
MYLSKDTCKHIVSADLYIPRVDIYIYKPTVPAYLYIPRVDIYI